MKADEPARLHSLERTSPKGQDFVGRCVLCGKEGLTFADMNDTCENPARISQADVLLDAIDPESPP